MTVSISPLRPPLPAEIQAYFQRSEGEWRSQRRYYTLKQGDTQEVISLLSVRYLSQGSTELRQLARLHGLADDCALTCGAQTRWESNYGGHASRESKGETVFGVLGSHLYRDRGFSTRKPVVARFELRDADTMRLFTEYGGNSFQEEIKLVGNAYRTRQTIISRAGEEQMIGQYLETRILPTF